MEEVSLIIDDQIFKAKKDVLCEHSDYFRAMFSGNYVENEKQEITIDVSTCFITELTLKRLHKNRCNNLP